MTRKMISQLEEYKENCKNLPEEAEGIYILLEGSVTVKNDFNPSDPLGLKGEHKEPFDLLNPNPKGGAADRSTQYRGRQAKAQVGGDRPEVMDVFGAEKFLQVQGYSHYGCLYSTAEKKAGSTTTCGFIRKEGLQLIPFYDLYALKQALEDRYSNPKYGKTEKLKKTVNDPATGYKAILNRLSTGQKLL